MNSRLIYGLLSSAKESFLFINVSLFDFYEFSKGML